MRIAIQIKLLIFYIALVLITTLATSATYYYLTKKDKHRESQQRIKIAFDIILDDLNTQKLFYIKQFNDFVQKSTVLEWILLASRDDPAQLSSPIFIISYPVKLTANFNEFKNVISANRLALYGADKRLLVTYQRQNEHNLYGMYLTSTAGHPTFISDNDPSKLAASDLLASKVIPDNPLPEYISGTYPGDLPEMMSIHPFKDGSNVGVRIVMPIINKQKMLGVLVGEIFYTQTMVRRYKSLSDTEVNLFAGNLLSVGTLLEHDRLELLNPARIPACETLIPEEIQIVPVQVGATHYYQAQCALHDSTELIGVFSVNLSQVVEKRAIAGVLTAVLIISGIAILAGLGISFFGSRKTVHAISNITRVIGVAAEGDLRPRAIATTNDEIGLVANKLNQMITRLRDISRQVQNSSFAVNTSADTILRQMESLIQHMEQQATVVDNTTVSIEKIKQFIDNVAHKTSELLLAAAQILESIQETRKSTNEVTTSTGQLTTNLHLISDSVDQVNQSVRQITDNTEQLETIARRTEAEVQHIDRSLQEVFQNADDTQKLAHETTDAATAGQVSVEASIQGMSELKDVVSKTATIIREVNSWGTQVSSILGIVDEITEQTALLSLNAAIISAQAGAQGRGFAVVADEIKELANRTKASTKEIGTLVHQLQKKTAEGVRYTEEGLKKADQGVHLANAVRDALNTILERATRSSSKAVATVKVIQQTTDSSRMISTSMTSVTEMASNIRGALNEEEQDVGEVVTAVENISGTATQVNRLSIEQNKAAGQIEQSMAEITEKFSDISEQTGTLQQNAQQILSAMHTIETITEQTLQNTADISGDTVKNLVQQSEMLQKLVRVFKVT